MSRKLIHGLEVLDMMVHQKRTYSRQTLLEAILLHFGSEATFYIHGADNLTAEELIDRLMDMGKFDGPEDAFTYIPSKV